MLYFLETPGDHVQCSWNPDWKFKSLKDNVFIEYPNSDPQGISSTTVHGNNRVSDHPYRPTNPFTMNKMEKMLDEKKRNAEINRKLDNPYNPEEGIRDSRQVNKMRHYKKKKDNPDMCGNESDQTQKLLSELFTGKSKYCQKMIASNDCGLPSLMFFKPHQIHMIRAFATTDSPNPWPLEIDMTYRLTNEYLIVTTIKNRGIVKKSWNQDEHRNEQDMTMMGPVFLCHTRNKFDYDNFLAELRRELDKITPKNWTGKYLILSDGDPGQKWALVKNFGDVAIFCGCQRHLESNVREQIVSNQPAKIQECLNFCFHDDYGLSTRDTPEELAEAESKINREDWKDPDLVLRRVREELVEPRFQEPRLKKNMKTQCVESQNHVFKEYENYEPQKLIPFSRTLEGRVDDESSVVIKAIIGTSTQYTLAEKYKKHYVNPTVWGNWGKHQPEKQQKHFLAFFKAPPKPRASQVITSQDGNLEVPLKARQVKAKPGTRGSAKGVRCQTNSQRKRGNADKNAASSAKRQRVMVDNDDLSFLDYSKDPNISTYTLICFP